MQDCYEFSLNSAGGKRGEGFRYNNALHVCLASTKLRKNDNVTYNEISNPGFFCQKIIQILIERDDAFSLFLSEAFKKIIFQRAIIEPFPPVVDAYYENCSIDDASTVQKTQRTEHNVT